MTAAPVGEAAPPREAATPDADAIWVGLLHLDADGPAAGVNGPVLAHHGQARILTCMHQAPLGYVSVPVQPEETLAARARTAARADLADALGRHAGCEDLAIAPDGPAAWEGLVACPRRFPPSAAAGLTVVICTRDRPEGLRTTLHTLEQVRYEPLEILVVDNAPTSQATREVVAAVAGRDRRVRYTCEPRPGLSRARNHGLAQAQFDLVAFTDDDALADPGWPCALAAGFAADPQTVCVTGLVASSALETSSQRYFDARYSWGDIFDVRRFDLDEHRDPSPLYPFSAGIFGTGANFAVRRQAVLDVGAFDPLLGAGGPGRGGEDLDMFLRLILAGGRITYLPSALIWHQHRVDPRALSRQIYAYGYGFGAYLAKHLMSQQLPALMLRRGLRRLGTVASRMRWAKRQSRMGTGGSQRLAVAEGFGMLAGVLRYYRAARRTAAD